MENAGEAHFGSCLSFLPSLFLLGINYDDGMGGGSVITNNVLANFCRESSDHGVSWVCGGLWICFAIISHAPLSHTHVCQPFNSWNRVPYIWDGPDGKPTTQKLNDTISYNFILANYHSR